MPSKPSVEEKPNPYCQCSRDRITNEPTGHGVFHGECFRRVAEPKNVVCRPCAQGNHEGKACDKWIPCDLTGWVVQKACKDCGMDPQEHPIPRELR